MLDTALRFIDEHGVAALSMRKLGAELGVEAMTLYHYLPNKAALLDGVVEQVVGMVRPPSPDVPWPDYLRGFADSLCEVLLRHPAVLTMVVARPVDTTARDALTGAGMPEGQAWLVVDAVTTFVFGHVLTESGRPNAGGEERFDLAITALIRGFGGTVG